MELNQAQDTLTFIVREEFLEPVVTLHLKIKPIVFFWI